MDAARTFEQGRCRRTLVLGVLCAGLGAVVGFGVSHDAVGQGWDRLAYYAAAAAALTFMLLWWLIMERRQRFGAVRGALTGAVGGLLAHYPCWYLVILGQNVSYWYLKYFGSSTTQAPIDPFEGLGGAFALSFWSWLLFGWLTAIIGAIAVGAYAWNINRRLRPHHLDRC